MGKKRQNINSRTLSLLSRIDCLLPSVYHDNELQPIKHHERQSTRPVRDAAFAVVDLQRACWDPLSGLSQSATRLERRRAVVLDPIADGDLTDRHRHRRLGRYPDPISRPSCPCPARQATLSWLGGTYQGADIAGFHIYGEHTPGAVSTTRRSWRPCRPTSPESSPTGLATAVSAREDSASRPARTPGPRSRSRGAPGTGASNRSTPPATRDRPRRPPSRSPRRRCRQPRSRT